MNFIIVIVLIIVIVVVIVVIIIAIIVISIDSGQFIQLLSSIIMVSVNHIFTILTR